MHILCAQITESAMTRNHVATTRIKNINFMATNSIVKSYINILKNYKSHIRSVDR